MAKNTMPEPQTDAEKIYRTTITTNRGTIVMDLDPQLAPATVNNFVGLARRLIAVPMASDKSLPPAAIAQTARTIGIAAEAAADLTTAFAAIAALDLSPPPRILITGSLYLAGEVLAANGMAPS